MAVALLAGGCSGPPEQVDEPGQPRRAALRERLRAELGSAYDRPLPPASPEQLSRGAELYDLLCEACHGIGGKGDGRSAPALAVPPADLSDPAQRSFFSERAKLEIVRQGIPGSAMIGWAGMVTDEESLGLVHFLGELVAESGPPSKSAEP
jgi:mono/diheme cytochrome c family protein